MWTRNWSSISLTQSVALASSVAATPSTLSSAAHRTRSASRSAVGSAVTRCRNQSLPTPSRIESITFCASRATSREWVAIVAIAGLSPISSPTVVTRVVATTVDSRSSTFASTLAANSAASPSSRPLSFAVSAAPALASSGAPSTSSASNCASFRARRSGDAVRSGVGTLGSASMNANTAGSSMGFRSNTIGARTTVAPTRFCPFSGPVPSSSSLIAVSAFLSNSGR